MMGHQKTVQDQLFYSFHLDDHVPQSHLLRAIDRVLDFSDLPSQLAGHYSHTGRPSVPPELMIRILIIGYCYGIRSERRLCEEVHLNLAYRWFCRLGLEDPVPEHSTFSKNRHGRFRESGIFRWLFESVVQRCMDAGLVQGEGFAVDASLIAANANAQQSVPGDELGEAWKGVPANRSRAVREYLEALDEAAPEESAPKRISLTDPQSRWIAMRGNPAIFAYSTNYLVDIAKGIILDVEATPAYRPAEVESTRRMIERVERQHALKPQRLIGDTAYGAAPMLAWLVEKKGIAPHVPVWDKSERNDGTFSRKDFVWEAELDAYRCPAGHPLRSDWRSFRKPRTRVTQEETIIYRSSQSHCQDCSSKPQCCPNTPIRKIARSVHETARDVARQLASTQEYQRSYRERKKVEILFAHLKRILRLDRLRLRGLSGATDEFTLAATAQNLRRLAKFVAQSAPTPGEGVPI